MFTTYNNLSIPYAYPPFGFYFARIVSDVFNISEISILRWLPPILNTLSILAFCAIASAILESRRLGALATVFYALTPGASAWFIMGGGLTRSFGSLFMLLSLWWVFCLFRNGGRREFLFSILFCSLTVLSHPEVGIHTAASCFLLWLFYWRSRRAALHALVVGLSTLVLSAPWWGTVLYYHGFAPFLSAINTGSLGVPIWRSFIEAFIASQTFIPMLPLFRIAGFIWGIWKQKYFLTLWAVIPFLVEPRSAPSIVFYPFCMLMALVIAEALPNFVNYWSKRKSELEFNEHGWLNISLLLITIYLFIEASLYGFKLINTSLSIADRDAMAWIQKSTPQQSRFLSITGVLSPEVDPFVEWFPALTERRNQTTIQGLEWLLGRHFYTRYDDLAEVQICKTENCIALWSARTGLDYDYIVVRKPDVKKALVDSLTNSVEYTLVYSSDDVLIYFLQKP